MSDANTAKPLPRQVRMMIEDVLRNRIKFIGDDEQVYTGCPNDLIDELFNVIRQQFYTP